ncbi:cytoplasmic protein [Coprinopsis cinerea okayama7|uniref:Cytoplasmic protein n=1 Tax=Coprinopsis cinerea (strain Okayama-7 / 130 / ATCC MYA-4618 / FGSC 9003) TaxID=240176 RepID=A8NUV5_COPC7|nr:cytoplasmic protein [Coprinopsis cinerea okayama7\|eukprot:XP_001836543.2 cytoplasmic protein [Coprinopsis cinerea okayama7\
MASSSRALNAILPQIPVAPYEAHQKARTFASRYVKSGQHDTAIDVLFQSARELLKTGQPGSGVDLGGFMLDVYDTKGETVTPESRGRVTQLIALTGSEDTWRKTLIDKAIAWSAKHGDCPAGDPELNYYVGELLDKEGSFDLAEPYLLAAGTRDSARLLAEMFLRWGASSSTYGPFALRGVIPYLQNGNVLAAKAFIRHFVSGLPDSVLSNSAKIPAGDSDEVVMTSDSLINFSQMAVLTCQRAQGDKSKVPREAWVRLCGTYQSKGGPLVAPEVRRALTEIAQLYFAIPPPRNHAANPLGDMISSLFGGPAAPTQPARRTLTPASGSGSGLD